MVKFTTFPATEVVNFTTLKCSKPCILQGSKHFKVVRFTTFPATEVVKVANHKFYEVSSTSRW